MKKILLAAIILLLATLSGQVQAQRVMGALIGGFNATNVQGDDVFGFYKFGLNTGAAAIVPFSEHWSFSLETLYTEKGSYHKEGGRGMDYRYTHDYNHYKLVLNYLEAPLLIHYNDRKRLKAGLGVSYSRLIKVREWEDHVRIATTTLNDGPYDLDDWSAVFDLQIPVYKQLRFNARYSFSLIKIREREYESLGNEDDKTRKQYNQVLSFRLMWVFNEKASKRARINEGF